MHQQFKANFVHVFGFDWNRAATHFGVHRRTILRWYEASPPPPKFVMTYMAVYARGWLPDYEPFSSWSIQGQDIYTPNGKVAAVDVEMTLSYKWAARNLQAVQANRHRNLSELLASVDRILLESEELKVKLRNV